jgi:hypothetical protein
MYNFYFEIQNENLSLVFKETFLIQAFNSVQEWFNHLMLLLFDFASFYNHIKYLFVHTFLIPGELKFLESRLVFLTEIP